MELIDSKTAAARLGVARSTLELWKRQGRPEIVAALHAIPGTRWVRWNADAIARIGRTDGEVRSDG